MQLATQHANPTNVLSQAGSRRIPVGQLTDKDVTLYRYVPEYGYVKNGNSSKSYAFFERPSKLSIAERLGIPKGERN